MIDLSIIIIGYKNYNLINNCLDSIYATTNGISFEIIIVSNDNEQLARIQLLTKFPALKWIGLGNNQGFSVANNVGIKHANGQNILLLNGDTLIPDLNLLLNCVFRLNKTKEVAAISVLQKNKEDKFVNLYKKFSFRKHFFLLPPFATVLLDNIFDKQENENPNEVDWLSGAFLMVKREVILKSGLMDEDFFLYAEDVEWCNRIGKHGKLIYFDDLYIYHLENSENPYRPKNQSFINKFDTQIQLSNLLWIRKQYGIFHFLILILNYILILPVIYSWKFLMNCKEFKSPFTGFLNQNEFAENVKIWLSFFWDILFLKKKLYKI